MSHKVKLSEILDDVFELELPDGTVKSYDPWAIQESFEVAGIKASLGTADIPATVFDTIRKTFAFPTSEDAAKTDPPAFTLSRKQCLWVQAEMLRCIAGLEVTKRLADANKAMLAKAQ